VKISGTSIGFEHKPFIVAEISGNHNQSLDLALEIVHSAKRSGVTAIKLQTYKPETLTIKSNKPDFYISDQNSPWGGTYLYDLYTKAFTPWEWHEQIFEEAKKLGLIYFSSVFDESSVDFLEDLNVPAYKIASFENIHYPLIAKAATTGKPLIISTGLANLTEIQEAVEVARDNGCSDLMLLKCTSAYPASEDDLNLASIHFLRQTFGCEVGFSDHTLGIDAAVTAIAAGANLIEKHFTIEKISDGVDSFFSATESEMKALVEACAKAHRSMGKVFFGILEKEKSFVRFRRSIYALKRINKGDIFSSENIGIIRPGYGMHPRHFGGLLGSISDREYFEGEAIRLDVNPKNQTF
jgi:N-acetylneuraminate synthase